MFQDVSLALGWINPGPQEAHSLVGRKGTSTNKYRVCKGTTVGGKGQRNLILQVMSIGKEDPVNGHFL